MFDSAAGKLARSAVDTRWWHTRARAIGMIPIAG